MKSYLPDALVAHITALCLSAGEDTQYVVRCPDSEKMVLRARFKGWANEGRIAVFQNPKDGVMFEVSIDMLDRVEHGNGRILFQWEGETHTLHVTVPTGIPAEYEAGFKHAVALHILKSNDAWFTPMPPQPYCLCIIDDEEPEPLLVGFTAHDWGEGLVPVMARKLKEAIAVIHLPNGRQREVKLLVGGDGKRGR